ncbi:MAG: hypothetical protein R8M46_09325 [Ghiorsea sp.]
MSEDNIQMIDKKKNDDETFKNMLREIPADDLALIGLKPNEVSALKNVGHMISRMDQILNYIQNQKHYLDLFEFTEDKKKRKYYHEKVKANILELAELARERVLDEGRIQEIIAIMLSQYLNLTLHKTNWAMSEPSFK